MTMNYLSQLQSAVCSSEICVGGAPVCFSEIFVGVNVNLLPTRAKWILCLFPGLES